MAALNPPSPPMSPSLTRRGKSFARRCERGCCRTILYFPLLFVYGLTTWAVWVQIQIGLLPTTDAWPGKTTSSVAIAFYILLNWSYTTAVFVSPGSTLDVLSTTSRSLSYTSLPTHEPHTPPSSLTVKSTGELRYCKKCQARKPDRAHHCSSCGRCVLKMDHHCPWLATCAGLRNYKPFLLFLIYTCLFCYACFATSAVWVCNEIAKPAAIGDDMMPVHFILLAVISGIFGLVLTAFTGWHIYLVVRGRTTIESLERVRYIAPIRKSVAERLDAQEQHSSDDDAELGLVDHLVTIHANALPGVTRPEEGESYTASLSSTPSPAQSSLRRTYAQNERSRELARYNDYLNEQATRNLPNAFDLGWRRNLAHVFGEKALLWWLPICNTTGDGWRWEVNPAFLAANDQLLHEREGRRREEEALDRNHKAHPRAYANGNGKRSYDGSDRDSDTEGGGWYTRPGYNGDAPGHWRYAAMPPQDWKRLSTIPSEDGGFTSSEDERPRFTGRGAVTPRTAMANFGGKGQTQSQMQERTANWNDLPEELLTPTRGPSRAIGVGRGAQAGPRTKDT